MTVFPSVCWFHIYRILAVLLASYIANIVEKRLMFKLKDNFINKDQMMNHKPIAKQCCCTVLPHLPALNTLINAHLLELITVLHAWEILLTVTPPSFTPPVWTHLLVQRFLFIFIIYRL